MKKYLLLRNNRETGPHCLEQLGSTGLLPMDLVWIENESTSWHYPEEIEELKNLVTRKFPSQKNYPLPATNRIFVSLPLDESQKDEQLNDKMYSAEEEKESCLKTDKVKPTASFKENCRIINQKKTVWDKRVFPSTHLASVAAVFIGVVLGAFVIKKMVDGAVPAYNEPVVAATPIIDREVEESPDDNIHNALVTEVIPVYKSVPVKTVKKKDLKKQLKVSANNYKVGLFGGINGLQLTVFNLSPQMVDKVIVALDYLKPNGTVIQSENVGFSTIKPKGAQTISIPGSDRGMKVRYRILKVYAHDYKADLKEI